MKRKYRVSAVFDYEIEIEDESFKESDVFSKYGEFDPEEAVKILEQQYLEGEAHFQDDADPEVTISLVQEKETT